jgi:FtsH-binding integral membrane protein
MSNVGDAAVATYPALAVEEERLVGALALRVSKMTPGFRTLFGLIAASLVNLFWANSTLYWVTTYAGVAIFSALTAYDMQKIKELNVRGNTGTDENKREAMVGALTLYLDFINLFLFLLRIFGRER